MPSTLEVLDSSQIHSGDFARDVLEGLSRRPKSIPSKYFYDRRGSEIFQQITTLEEYYPTRCELEILNASKDELARKLCPRPFRLIELGTGDGRKTEILIEHFAHRGLEFEYVPVDICRQSVEHVAGKLEHSGAAAGLRVHGIVADYFDALRLLSHRSAERNLVLFLGSNIGNFNMSEARHFLESVRESINPGDYVLAGFDLKKDPDLLHRAYSDRQGVTSEFNYNLLDRVNNELGADFDRDRFVHHASYNVVQGCMESWLISTQRQEVCFRSLERTFSLVLLSQAVLRRVSGFGI